MTKYFIIFICFISLTTVFAQTEKNSTKIVQFETKDKGKLNKTGNKTGKWIEFNYLQNDSVKIKSVTKYKNGIKHGKFIEYQLTKEKATVFRKGRHKNGKLNGKIKVYDSLGRLSSVAIFKNNEIVSIKSFNYY